MRTKLPSFWFYRCSDCLSVASTEEQLGRVYNPKTGLNDLNAVCDACGGKVEFMGEGKRYDGQESWMRSLVGHTCPCDSRCTNAPGPKCECSCGGKNHGTGALVPVYKDSPVPRVGFKANAVANAVEFRAMKETVKAAWEAKYGQVYEDKRNGYRVNWDFFREGGFKWEDFNRAKRLKTHKGRMSKMKALVEEFTAKKVAA